MFISPSHTDQLDVVSPLKDIQDIIRGYINSYELTTTIHLANKRGVKRITYNNLGNYFGVTSDAHAVTFWESAKLVALQFKPRNECLNICPLADHFLMIEKDELLSQNEITTGMPVRDPVKLDLRTRLIHASKLSHFATASPATIQLWDKATLQCTAKLKVKKPIITIQCAPYSDQIAFSSNYCISIWHSQRNTVIDLENVFANKHWTQIAFSHNGEFLIARSHDTISSWHLQNYKQIKYITYSGHFSHLAFLPRGNSFAIIYNTNGSKNSKIIFFDTQSFTHLYQLESAKIITSFDFSPDHLYLIAGTADSFLEIYKNSPVISYTAIPQKPYVKKANSTENCCLVS